MYVNVTTATVCSYNHRKVFPYFFLYGIKLALQNYLCRALILVLEVLFRGPIIILPQTKSKGGMIPFKPLHTAVSFGKTIFSLMNR